MQSTHLFTHSFIHQILQNLQTIKLKWWFPKYLDV